jgi:CRISPR type III-A-associated protein Csm2
MDDEVQPEVTPAPEVTETETAPAPASQTALGAALAAAGAVPSKTETKPEAGRPPRPEGSRPPRREDRPPRPPGEQRADQRASERREHRPGGGPSGDRGREGRGGDRGGERREGPRPGGGRPFEGPPDIELEKLISDSLYLDNQAHGVVARMRDMDSGTKSQLRRLYNAVRRAVRAPESERQHQFVMLRARLAYTIARHSLRSLDALERLLLQVTRRNDARGYERFKDLFEAIVAYNE